MTFSPARGPRHAGLRVKKDEPLSATYKEAPYLDIHISREASPQTDEVYA